MVCTLKGYYTESGTFTNKNGKVVPFVRILSGRDVVQVNDCVMQKQVEKFTEVTLPVDVRSTDYGLLVRYLKDA